MDYNILANQSVNSTKAPGPTTRAGGSRREAYIAGFQRAYETNRAPYFVGNHFEQWNGGIYMDAVEDRRAIAGRPRTCGWSPSASSSTGWTCRTPPSWTRLRTLPVGTPPPAAGGPSSAEAYAALAVFTFSGRRPVSFW